MAFRVMIVEDKPDLRRLLSQHLDEPFRREIQHVRPESWIKHAEEHLTIQSMSEPALNALVKAKEESTVQEIFVALKEQPDLIITDLALSKKEVEKLDNRGGTEVSGAKDPTKQLDATTGFQILRAMAPEVPVIATTYASNPRIIEACWKAGAHAVIPKPATDEQMSACYALKQYSKNPYMKLTESQKRKGRRWSQRIETYLGAIAQEVLKAMQAKALAQMESVVPSQLPYWLALDHDRLDGRRIEDTSLMMLEIKGFFRLTELGMVKPKALFRLVNEMWDEIHPLLEKSGAEINHFSGETALIFSGVYDDGERNTELEDTLRCGAEVSSLFDQLGPLRMRLVETIWDCYDAAARRDMVKQVEGDDFDAQIISIQPLENHALYGKIGGSSRWQHSTLSRYFDLLHAAKSEINRVKSMLAREQGESFLLYNRHEKPEIPGFEITPLDSLLSKPVGSVHSELSQWKIHRVLKAPDRELV
jgi:CheY-like chemotaxis protein